MSRARARRSPASIRSTRGITPVSARHGLARRNLSRFAREGNGAGPRGYCLVKVKSLSSWISFASLRKRSWGTAMPWLLSNVLVGRVSSGAGPAVPGHRGRGVAAQPSFHDEGVFARVEVVSRAPADDLEAQALVQPERVRVARAHLEEGQGHPARTTLGHGQGEEPFPYPTLPPIGMYGEVGDVNLVADLP